MGLHEVERYAGTLTLCICATYFYIQIPLRHYLVPTLAHLDSDELARHSLPACVARPAHYSTAGTGLTISDDKLLSLRGESPQQRAWNEQIGSEFAAIDTA
jgi:hypothetical protein